LRAARAWHVIGPHDIYSALGMPRWAGQAFKPKTSVESFRLVG